MLSILLNAQPSHIFFFDKGSNKVDYNMKYLSLFLILFFGSLLKAQISDNLDNIEQTIDEYLIPLEKNDLFNGTVLIRMEKLTFIRDENNKVVRFEWESGDVAKKD